MIVCPLYLYMCVCGISLPIWRAFHMQLPSRSLSRRRCSQTTTSTGSVCYSTSPSPSPHSYSAFYFICYSLLLLPRLLNSLSSPLPHSLTKPLNACCAAICHKYSLYCGPTALLALLLGYDCRLYNCAAALQPTSLPTSPSLSSARSPSLCVLLLML